MTSLAKKVIALLLCVSMFASLTAMAFADGPAGGAVNPYEYYEKLRRDYVEAAQKHCEDLREKYYLDMLDRYLNIVAVYSIQKEAYDDWSKGMKALTDEQYAALMLNYEMVSESAKEFVRKAEEAMKAGYDGANEAYANVQKALSEGVPLEEAMAQANASAAQALDDMRAAGQAAAEDYAETTAIVKQLSEEEDAELKRKRKLLQEELERRLREAKALAESGAAGE